MDAVASLLDGPRARGAFLLRSRLEPPWSMRIEDEAPLTLVTVVTGGAVVVADDGPPLELAPGDVALLRGPDPYVVADSASTPPQVAIGPGQECRALVQPPVMRDLDVRTWGNDPAGSTYLVTGTYAGMGEVSRRLLATLPARLLVRATERDDGLVRLLAEEVGRDLPGQESVLDRLLDLHLVAVLRAELARPSAGGPRWYAAHGDPVVGPALRLVQDSPGAPWTVASLAQACGTSRAAFARRFTELVGEPPMAFLTSWRLSLAADLLLEPETTLDAVARRVGYGSAYALSAAFKRERGVSPAEFRRSVSR
ncbi:AraC family transcriptional regulator [Motilibacter rhizosphaerae]|uniref:AraC family transcriptional regulator n=1 Tax=Motilibacter rhizosphaerae TaxID=598652 RepID=A0A4Q7NSS3_9ACTN|nr:AraC family transcriptional regulator [Motilibacter rhizosphaerae]RZS90085.1 AraC family transcriptional regulator [Motilibacter rhizosphaerae]